MPNNDKRDAVGERRFVELDGAEVRQDDNDAGKLHFRGHAAIFDEVADIGGAWRERIDNRAFNRTINNNADVRFLVNHDGNLLGARTKSGTLKLGVDKRGLITDADLDRRQSYINDLAIAMERGDLDQMSFAFRATKDDWDEEPEDGGLPVRTIQEVQLFDVSPVTFPAYEGTDAEFVSARALIRARPEVAEIVKRSNAPGDVKDELLEKRTPILTTNTTITNEPNEKVEEIPVDPPEITPIDPQKPGEEPSVVEVSPQTPEPDPPVAEDPPRDEHALFERQQALMAQVLNAVERTLEV